MVALSLFRFEEKREEVRNEEKDGTLIDFQRLLTGYMGLMTNQTRIIVGIVGARSRSIFRVTMTCKIKNHKTSG